MGNIKEKKVGVARLYPTRYDNSKGTRIGPLLFSTVKTDSNLTNYWVFKNDHIILENNF